MKKFFSKTLLLQLCVMAIPYTIYGIDLNFKRYVVENGLASNIVYDIIQDSEGYMWFGTENGLNRFDGYEFINYINIPRDTTSLVNNYVYVLCEDSDKNLWVGTEKGISLYKLEQKQFRLFTAKTDEGVAITERIQNIITDEKGQLWINSCKQGVFVYNRQNKLKGYYFNEYKTSEAEPIWVTCVFRDKDNTIWVSVNNTKHQLYKLDKATDRFVPAFPNIDPLILKKLTSYAIVEDTFGTLWLGTWANGLYAIDKEKGIKANYLNTDKVDKILHIHSMTEYETGHLLIGSNDGLTVFTISPTAGNKREMQLTEPTISNRFVYPIYKDREGGLWIGTYYGGINYSSPNRNYFTSYTHDKYKNSISGNVVSVFCEDPIGNLWIGTEDEGLNYFDTKTEQFTVYKPNNSGNSLSFHNIHSLCVDDNQLWIGTYSGGLNVMDLTTRKFRYYYTNLTDTTTINSNSIYALYKDSRNNIWVGTVSGINRYNRRNDNFERLKNLNSVVVAIVEFDNKVWFATNGDGLYTYNLETEHWKHYQYEAANYSSLISNEVTCLCIDDNQQLWVGTNNGLCKFNAAQESFCQEKTHFRSNTIYGVFSINAALWIATTKGLVYYDPKNNQSRFFTKDDGLLSEQFIPNSGIKTTSGRIYMGTANGFNAFYPKQIVENKHTPQVSITDFQLFNVSTDMSDYLSVNNQNIKVLTLPHNENSFSFTYTALSYFAPEKNEYAFILEGFDKGWNYVNKVRKATYTNIAPGEYYFRVKASNNDGVWNENGQVIKIIITPPFWWNAWSISFYVLLLIIFLFVMLSLWKRRDEEKNTEKINKIRAEQEKEAYDSKINFFTTIVHEIRTPVSLIIGPLEQISKKTDTLPKNIVDDLKIIDRNSQRLLTLINQLLDFRKIEKETIQISYSKQNIYEFILNIYDRFKPFMQHKHITFIYTCDNKNFCTGIDVENITKVISNLLSNASKYTKDYVELKLEVNPDNSGYAISVIDNGRGIPESEYENIFKPFYQISGGHKSGTGIGLHLVKSIIDVCKGEIKLKSDAFSGLSFTVLLPAVDVDDTESTPTNEPYMNPQTETQSLDITTADDYKTTYTSLDDKLTLLIVEDDMDMQAFLLKNLTDSYHILFANNGVEGIGMLEKHETDIIISDIMMPEMDGIAFCKNLKSNPLWSHIPIILLTAKTNILSKIEALEVGADAYVEKPFSISYLLTQLKNLIESRKNLLKKFTETPFVTLKSIAGNKTDEAFLTKLNDIIERNISNVDFNIEQLAEELCISSSGLFAKIKTLSNLTPNKLLLLVRLKKAAELLIENNYRVNEVSYKVGFNNPSYFAKCFQKQYGVLPKDFRDSQMANQNN